jgi:hypothetical protein
MPSLCSVTSGTFETLEHPVKYDRRDAGDGISWAGAPLGKKHPATGDGVKVREETPKGKITPAREMDHAAIPPAEV